MNDLLMKLAKPFEPSAIAWKPGAATKDGMRCMAMAYADLRAYQERLDVVCGMEWNIEYQPWGDQRLIACLTINGITRCSTGEADTQDEKNGLGGSVTEAMAFKRAAAMFGLGRYLYGLPAVWVEFDSTARRISKAGEAELNKRYRDWYALATQKSQGNAGGVAASQQAAPARSARPGPATPATDDAAAFNRMVPGANAGGSPPWAEPGAGLGAAASGQAVDGDVLFERTMPWYATARNSTTNDVYKLCDKMLELHRSGGPASAKQYGWLAGLLDSIIHQATGASDGHKRVLPVLCQAEIGKDNPPSATLASKLLDRLATYIKDDADVKQINSEYSQAVTDAMIAIYRAAEAVGTSALLPA